MRREKMTSIGIGKRFLKFFVKNRHSRWVLLQGGRRSGKSFAAIRWLWFLASAKTQTIMCVAATYPALRNLIDDFQRASGLTVSGTTLYGYTCLLSNGSRFIFRSYDDPTKTQGTPASIVYLEEALNINEQIINTLSMSVTGQVYAAYNPTRQTNGGVLNHINKDKSNLLLTTWRDNEYLTEAQKEEFEEIKRRALRPGASILDEYNYRVYYLGEFAEMSGKVFNLVYTCTDEEFDKIPVVPVYGLDFGFVESKDMTSLVALKIFNDNIYAKELIYDNTELFNDKKLAFRMAELGLDVYSNIVADYGGMGRTRIKNLVSANNGEWTEPGINAGFSIQNARKGRVIDSLQRMLQYSKIFVTDSSENLRREMDGYELKNNGTPVGDDHAVDAVRYAVNSWSIVNG